MKKPDNVSQLKEVQISKKRDNITSVDKPVTVLGKETVLTGDLSFKTSLKINGEFKGTISTTGYLEIASDAKVEADVEATIIKIAGQLKGNINRSDRVELVDKAQMFGNIKTKLIKIEDGVLFQGECNMIK